MIILFSILSYIFTFLFIKTSLPFLKKNFLDHPNKRSLHLNPTPKGGGLIFAIIGSLFLFALNNKLGLFCLPIAFIGLIDDKYNLSRKLRYISHFISVLFLYLISDINYNFTYSQNHLIQIFFLLIIIIIGTAIINFTNFMDGIDGLVSGCMTIWFGTIAIAGYHDYFVLVTSLIAFIFFNWYPAKIFMGDAGSTFLGLIVVGALLNMQSISFMINSMLILSPLYLDSISCIVKRLLKKQNIFTAHNLHLYQRLHKSGISKSNVSLIYILNTIILSIAFLTSYKLLYIFIGLTIIFGIVLDQKKAYNF